MIEHRIPNEMSTKEFSKCLNVSERLFGASFFSEELTERGRTLLLRGAAGSCADAALAVSHLRAWNEAVEAGEDDEKVSFKKLVSNCINEYTYVYI